MSWPKHARDKNRWKKGAAPGPGRPKDTPEKKAQRMALMDYYKRYLESGEAVVDFEKWRKHTPGPAIQEATDRVHGKAPQHLNLGGKINLGAIKIVHSD